MAFSTSQRRMWVLPAPNASLGPNWRALTSIAWYWNTFWEEFLTLSASASIAMQIAAGAIYFLENNFDVFAGEDVDSLREVFLSIFLTSASSDSQLMSIRSPLNYLRTSKAIKRGILVEKKQDTFRSNYKQNVFISQQKDVDT